MDNKTHWKKLSNPQYIGAYTLMETGQPVDMNVKIQSITREKVVGENSKEDECTVAKLVGQKPFIINATNAKTLTKLFGSPFIEDWVGKWFTLYVAKVKVARETVEALRIRPTLPDIKLPELTPDNPKWDGALKALQAGNTTIEKIKKSYSISKENEKKLTTKNTPENDSLV